MPVGGNKGSRPRENSGERQGSLIPVACVVFYSANFRAAIGLISEVAGVRVTFLRRVEEVGWIALDRAGAHRWCTRTALSFVLATGAPVPRALS